MNYKRSALFALRWCASSIVLIVCWAVWLALSALLVAQIWIVTHRELALPGFALRALEHRLAASQVTARFGRAVFDPTGRFVIEHVQLFSPTHPTPLVTIRAAYAGLDFWALLVGNVRLHELRLTGAELHVPAMLSPSGTDEAVLSDLDGIFHLSRSDYSIALCTFRIAGLPVTGQGGFHLPAAARSRASAMPMLDLLLQRYLNAGRKVLALRPQLDALEEPRLRLQLAPSEKRGAVVEAEFFARTFHPAGPVRVTMASVGATFPLLGDTAAPVRVKLEADGVAWEGCGQARQLLVDLAGSLVPDRFAFTPQAVRAAAARGEVMAVPFETPLADVALAQFPRLQGDVAARAGGSAVALHGEANVKTGDGKLELTGAISPALLGFARDKTRLAVLKRFELREPAVVQGTAEFASGWKPLRAEGDVSVRQAIAQDVAIDAARAHVTYAGHDLRVNDLILLQGSNEARGSYSVDTVTRDYRFLLHGQMRPFDIAGWFKPSWSHFWDNFDFTVAPPVADVDVRGRWGTPRLSAVFCQVVADHPGIRGVPFDRVRTILFFRPYYYHVFEFTAEHAGRSAHGSFVLATDAQRATYRTLDFNGISDLDIAECARIYGPAGTALVAPLQFAEPPTVRSHGHLDGPANPGGPQRKVQIELTSHGRAAFHQFPLENLRFTADIDNDTIDLPKIEAGLGGGTAAANARLTGRADARRLAFDASLRSANLGHAIDAFEEYQTARQPAAPERPKGRFIENAAECELSAALKAEGRYQDFFSYRGDGNFQIHGHGLIELPLLKLLFELLSKPLLNFKSQRLDNVQANFTVEGRRLVFPELKITGPSAAIEAGGEYLLDAKTLDFTARISPFKEHRFVLTDVLGAALSPLLSTLEVRLTGQLANPSWSLTFLRSLAPARGADQTAPAAETAEKPLEIQLVPDDSAGAIAPTNGAPPQRTAPGSPLPAGPAPARPGSGSAPPASPPPPPKPPA
jgi:hypothetical protein